MFVILLLGRDDIVGIHTVLVLSMLVVGIFFPKVSKDCIAKKIMHRDWDTTISTTTTKKRKFFFFPR